MVQLPKARLENIVVQEAGKELLIYDLKTNKAYCLNKTSAMVYQPCDGTKSVSEIISVISGKLKVSIGKEFIWLALDGLNKSDLLENNVEFEINFGELNRRQIIRKVGLSSMVALPIISSIVAPQAIMAQSGSGLDCSTIANNCCVPGNLQGQPANFEFCVADGSICATEAETLETCCSGQAVNISFGFCEVLGFQQCRCI